MFKTKSNRRLFMLRTLKHFNCPLSLYIQVFTGYVRPILEYCARVFHSNLTKKQTDGIERIQKRACKIILSFNYSTYENALETCNITSLKERREKLLSFAFNLEKHPIHSSWLPDQRRVNLNLRNVEKYSQRSGYALRAQNLCAPSIWIYWIRPWKVLVWLLQYRT